MPFVDLPILPHDLGHQMGDMRIWLDRHKVETSGFSITKSIARLEFREELHAEAFAYQFGGRVLPVPDQPGNGKLPENLPIVVTPLIASAERRPANRRQISPPRYGRSERHERGARAVEAKRSVR